MSHGSARRRAPRVLAAALAFLAAPLAGQGWSLDAAVGRTAHAAVPGSAGELGATLGARFDGPAWLALYGSVPFEAEGARWASGALGARLGGTGRSLLGLDLALSGYAYRDALLAGTGTGATGAALPLLAVGAGPARLELRSGVMHHSSAFGDSTASRTVHHSDARLGLGRGPLRVSAEARWVRAAEADYPYAGGQAELGLGAGSVSAFAGRWISDRIDGTAWGVEGRLHAGQRTDLFAGYRRETEDPLHWAGSRSTWSAGLSRRLGGASPLAGGAAPASQGGRTTFRIPLSASRQAPSLGGDFTGWAPVPMAREGRFWTVTLPVQPGVHRYAFRAADGDWFVPASVPGRTDDGFGGVSAIVVVP